jgi:secreted PhoX family phosphatase
MMAAATASRSRVATCPPGCGQHIVAAMGVGMMVLDRRAFLRSGVGAAGMLALAGPFRGVVAHAAGAAPGVSLGPLSDRPDLADGVVRLRLPEGYVYRSFSPTGATMTDGVTVPGRHDGMAAFNGPGKTIRLVRNHEVADDGAPLGDVARSYDTKTRGGTTTLAIDAKDRTLLGDWVSLTGSSFNCAGGATPWGTWLSVEETVNGPDVGRDFAGEGAEDFTQRHGYLFEVSSRWGPGEYPKVLPIRNVGRFAHEAVAIDPRTGILYLTEDDFEFPSGIYRYQAPVNPMKVRAVQDGGTLEMLRVRGSTSPALLGGVLAEGTVLDVDWVPIPQPDFDGGRQANDDAIQIVAKQGFAQNAAKFARPEGIIYSSGALFFTCTRGGATVLDESPNIEYGNGFGQVWRLDPFRGRLTLLFQSPGADVLDLPDNITITSRGTLVLCEDSTAGNFIRLLTKRGELIDFAENRRGAPEGTVNDEFAGAAVSPDGRTLFVNIQAPNGRTFAIWSERGGSLRF